MAVPAVQLQLVPVVGLANLQVAERAAVGGPRGPVMEAKAARTDIAACSGRGTAAGLAHSSNPMTHYWIRFPAHLKAVHSEPNKVVPVHPPHSMKGGGGVVCLTLGPEAAQRPHCLS